MKCSSRSIELILKTGISIPFSISAIISAIATNILFILFGASLISNSAKADHTSPEVRTQINEQTDLFEKSVGDMPSFQKKLEADKQAGINSLGNGNSGSNPQGMSLLNDLKSSELEDHSSKLDSIKPNDLNSRGRDELIKAGSLSELYVDYSKPLNKRHLEDAKLIADAQESLLDNLIDKLKTLGVDCKTVKGDKIHEPEYYLQVKTTNHKDTIYNKTFCEELRESYNCTDSVTMRCVKTLMQYKEWKNEEFIISGYEVHNQHGDWFEWVYWRTASGFGGADKYEADLKPSAAGSIRAKIAAKLNVKLEQVELLNHNSARPGSGDGGLMHEWPQDRFRMFISYRIPYRTRPQGVEICEEWSEIWNERCTIK